MHWYNRFFSSLIWSFIYSIKGEYRFLHNVLHQVLNYMYYVFELPVLIKHLIFIGGYQVHVHVIPAVFQ